MNMPRLITTFDSRISPVMISCTSTMAAGAFHIRPVAAAAFFLAAASSTAAASSIPIDLSTLAPTGGAAMLLMAGGGAYGLAE